MPLSGSRPSFFGSVGLYVGDRTSPAWTMAPDEANGYVAMVGEFLVSPEGKAQQGLPAPSGLYVSGGEPMSRVDDLVGLLQVAKRYGMPAEVVTSARWVHDDGTARRVVGRLRSLVQLLTIRTSAADLERFGLPAFEALLRAVREVGLSLQVVVEIGEGNPYPHEILGLEVLNSDTAVLRTEVVDHSSEADGGLSGSHARVPEQFRMMTPPRHSRCAERMGFVIVAGGDVYPCATGVGCPELRLGNLNAQSLSELLRTATSNRTLLQLRTSGPYFLYEEDPGAIPDGPGYLGACDFHRQLLRSRRPAGAESIHMR